MSKFQGQEESYWSKYFVCLSTFSARRTPCSDLQLCFPSGYC